MVRRPDLCCFYVIKVCEARNYAELINHDVASPGCLGGWGNFQREFKVQCDESEVPTMSSATVFVLSITLQKESTL